MKTWSMAINQDEGDLDAIPTALVKTLMPARTGMKNPLRENGAKKLERVPDTIPPPAFPPPSQPPPMPYYQPPHGYYGLYHASGYPPNLLPPPPSVTLSPQCSIRRRDRSSSLPSELDSNDDKLTEYLE